MTETHDKRTGTHACDLISRQAVLALPRNITRNMRGEAVEETIDVSAIKGLPSAQPEQRWIPCTPETMPKVREWVLCQCRAGIMDVLRLTEDGDWNKNYPHAEYMGGFVIAWMPLPDIYKKGESDG